MSDGNDDPIKKIKELYGTVVRARHPDYADAWPVLSGSNSTAGEIDGGWQFILYTHTGNPVYTAVNVVGKIPSQAFGRLPAYPQNADPIREHLYRHFRATSSDIIMLIDADGILRHSEIAHALHRHEMVMELSPMKIFLSHKGADKPLVRDFKETLTLLGFDPWLDEDAMTAGMEPDRAILQGMKDSCAAVFIDT